MAITLESFRKAFPEFEKASTDVINSRLAMAQARYDADAYGKIYEQLVYTYAAHLISLTPGGLNQRKGTSMGETGYTATYKDLERLHYKRGLPY